MSTITHPLMVPSRARHVSQEEFYARMNPLDVSPCIPHGARWDAEFGYTSEWKLRSGAIIGWSVCGDAHGSGKNKSYWLAG